MTAGRDGEAGAGVEQLCPTASAASAAGQAAAFFRQWRRRRRRPRAFRLDLGHDAVDHGQRLGGKVGGIETQPPAQLRLDERPRCGVYGFDSKLTSNWLET
jgi:hypothetical protein